MAQPLKAFCPSETKHTTRRRGIFYDKYPQRAAAEGQTKTTINLRQELVYHRLGRPQSEDVMLMRAPDDHPEWILGAEITDDGRWVPPFPQNTRIIERCMCSIIHSLVSFVQVLQGLGSRVQSNCTLIGSAPWFMGIESGGHMLSH